MEAGKINKIVRKTSTKSYGRLILIRNKQGIARIANNSKIKTVVVEMACIERSLSL